MSNTQERVKQRREYLKRQRVAYTKFSLVLIPAALCFLLTCFLFLATFLGWMFINTVDRVGLILITLLLGWITRHFWRIAERVSREAAHLPYVPPVTADTLPADEVLVRGSEEPKEQGKVLLRGTDGSTGTGEQELLRSSQGQAGE